MLFFITQLICSAEAPYELPPGLIENVSVENQNWMKSEIVRVCPPKKEYLRPLFRVLLNNTCISVAPEKKNQIINMFRNHPMSLFLAEMNVEQLDSMLAIAAQESRPILIERIKAAYNTLSPRTWAEYGELLIERQSP
ncbi:MAG: hypothetical protein Q7T35_01850, partial [Nitrosomonas sp.]|nr:hypothetical protein [Nitrosomonas sp.]